MDAATQTRVLRLLDEADTAAARAQDLILKRCDPGTLDVIAEIIAITGKLAVARLYVEDAGATATAEAA